MVTVVALDSNLFCSVFLLWIFVVDGVGGGVFGSER